jgi:hypothetical protein
MQSPDHQESRVDSLVAALLYLMTHYARTGCPRLAICISRHLQCVARHPQADSVVRDVCVSLRGSWAVAAGEADQTHTTH